MYQTPYYGLKKNCVPFRIRSGGHSYEGYSTGDEVLVIDISKMNSISIDEGENTLTCRRRSEKQAAVHYVASKGYAFPGGNCPTGGVCGDALGGDGAFHADIQVSRAKPFKARTYRSYRRSDRSRCGQKQ